MRKVLYSSAMIALLVAGCNTPEKTEDVDVEAPLEVPTQEETPDVNREPTKEIVQSVEGQDETIQMDLVVGKESAYSLYIDKERYTFETDEDRDVLTPTLDIPEGYPEVNMEFLLVDDKTPEEVKEDLKKEYLFTLDEEQVTTPVPALSLRGKEGEKPDSSVVTIYLVEAGSGTLLITENSFLEAQEGHGARFYQMLETLELNIAN
ncbi:hypothetical protein DV702_05765 [Sporosarcina sp. PTS2304]|uniref:hypothetical protein n=1 Tax=Sporosarcina sp. PTS2304 TaxID=2283194 RepID=UPI000E0D24F6|nr:hypothetical protein [Sporosarcina sp. PTS2304]AXH99290.1 hypothetical protein DV702_05765 [Sporosarcina sp. PTS2304]